MNRKIKKIALINPKKDLSKQNPRIYQMFDRNNENLKLWFAPPLSLLIIAAHTPKDIEITIIDEFFEKIDFTQEYDLVGITAMTQQANRAYEIAEIYRKKNTYVVMGGIHATVMPDEALQNVNTVFLGESEETWELFLNEFKSGNEKKIYSSSKVTNLGFSKRPRYELINYEQYKSISSYFKFLPVQATRGCPHDCSFCVVSKFYGRKIRKKSIEQVVRDIEYIQSLKYDSLLMFTDDNFFVDRKYAKELLKALISLKIKFVAQSDVKLADDNELMELAYKSGCVMVLVGFESINPCSISEVNDNNWKMRQIANYETTIKKIQSNGIVVFGAFVIGFKSDNLNSFQHVRDFALKNNIPGQFTLLTPIPGSRVYSEMEKEDRLLKKEFWDNCSFFDMNIKHDKIPKEEAEKQIVWLHEQVYSDENVMKRNYHMMQIYKKLPPRWN